MTNQISTGNFNLKTQKQSRFPCLILTCSTLFILFLCLISFLIFIVFYVNSNPAFLTTLLNGKGDSELQSNLFKFDQNAYPITKSNTDYSTKKFYNLFGSIKHGISFYYPSTHFISDNDYSVDISTYDDGIDSNISEIDLKIIDLKKLNEIKNQASTILGSVKDIETESLLVNGFAGYEISKSEYLSKNTIEGKSYDIKTYKSNNSFTIESKLVIGCTNTSYYNYDTIFLNYNFFATIGYRTGFACDAISGKASTPIAPDAKEFELTYSILNNVKYLDNQKDIQTFKDNNNYQTISSKINKISIDYGVNIYFDTYPQSFITQTSKYTWSKSDFKSTFDNASATNILSAFYNELIKYPKSFIQTSGIKTFAFVKDLSSPSSKREFSGLSLPNLNIIFFDISNIHSEEFFSSTFHHELMHIFDFTNDYYDVIDTNSYWNELNKTGDYVGIDKSSANETLYATNNYTVRGFATGYAKSDIFEDRAETFRFLVNPSDYKYARYKIANDSQFALKFEKLKQQLQSFVPEMSEIFFTSIHYEN